MKPRTVPVFEDRLQTLRAQVDRFRVAVDIARSEYDALTAASKWHSRTSSQVTQINGARERLLLATQGLRSAERLLSIAVDVWSGQTEPTVRIRVCPSCRCSLPDALFTDDGVCDICRGPP
jgi:hypothetical protein